MAQLQIVDERTAGRPIVLVVDDDLDILLSIAEILEDRGFEVVTASDGKEGLEKLRRGARPAVILADLMMPMNGWFFRSALLADPALAEIPVIVMTAAADYWGSPERIAARLQKPIDLDELDRELDRILS